MPPTKLVKASIFTALAIGAGYALLMVPNVELITAIVFISGVWLGVGWGMIIGMTAELVFSVLHPLGSGLAVPPLLLAQVVSMGITGLAGGLSAPLIIRWGDSILIKIFLLFNSILLTFIFDSLTTLSFPVSAGFDWPQTKAIFLTGIGFTILHQFSNAFIFVIGIPYVLNSSSFRSELKVKQV